MAHGEELKQLWNYPLCCETKLTPKGRYVVYNFVTVLLCVYVFRFY